MRRACVLVGMLLLAGCSGGPGKEGTDAAGPSLVACVHPHPCGDGREWPVGLEGPFDVGRYEHLSIAMPDGVVLDGGVVLPDVPGVERLPTVLLLTPYVGIQNEPGDTPGILDYTFDAPVRRLVEEGYAFATVSIRGTGNSGGCFSFFQPDEQTDAPVVVEHLAAQPWSNGRIGGIGVSYPATEALMMAVAAPPSLKTVVVGGTHGDPYLRVATPQGLTNTHFAAADAFLIDAAVSYAPPAATPSDPAYGTIDHVGVLPERVCGEPFESRKETLGQVGDDRDAAHWDERRLTDRFANVTAAVWYVQGYEDRGLDFTDDLAWPLLAQAPKRILSGNWGHELPDGGSTGTVQVPDFSDRLVAWFDYWLKGLGAEAPGLGLVEFQDGAGTWHASTAWPPAGARGEALYLDGDHLAASPGAGSVSFVSAPTPGFTANTLAPRAYEPEMFSCFVPGEPLGLLAISDPVAEDTLLAGNPHAYLEVTSDQPMGQLTLVVLDLPPDAACPLMEGIRDIGWGGADLRYHRGVFVAEPFPVGAPTWVRIDLHGIQETLPAGHSLAVMLGYGDPTHRHATGAFPTLTIGGGSFVDLPVVRGGFGAAPAPVAVPPRPFQPADT